MSDAEVFKVPVDEMLKNYLITAWRNILKNKRYAAINILGLATGLSIYIFSSLLATYEYSHDLFFENVNRTFTIGVTLSPIADIGIKEVDGVHSAVAPLLESEVPDIVSVARTVRREYLISVDENRYYQNIRFADKAFLTIFDFEYIEGNDRALDDPMGLLLTESAAKRIFGDGPSLGKKISLNNEADLHVTAVVRDLPANTHFNTSLFIPGKFEFLAPLSALANIANYETVGTWDDVAPGNMTYVLVPPEKTELWLQAIVDGLYDRHFPESNKEIATGFRVRPLVNANTFLWDAFGLPAVKINQLLGFLVLIVAIVNYTNLATAQSLNRAREVGLRKTMGAGQSQLLLQFFVESLTIVSISMLIVLGVLEVMIPIFNTALDKSLVIDYATTVPWLISTTVIVGFIAAAYPAHLITKTNPIEALRDGGSQGVKGGLFRSLMLSCQFTISIFLLATVVVIYFQNIRFEMSSYIYPRSQILTLQKLQIKNVQKRLDTLKNEIKLIPGVTSVSFSRRVPYQQGISSIKVSRVRGDEARSFFLGQFFADFDFMQTYDVPLLTGRKLSKEVATDTQRANETEVNVILNRLAVASLGIDSPTEAIGKRFYDITQNSEPRTFTIVGVIPDQPFLGWQNDIKPMLISVNPMQYAHASIRIEGAGIAATAQRIDTVWDDVFPDYPMQAKLLDEEFDRLFQIASTLTKVVSGVAILALILSMIGLYGLAAFMAAVRTKEIGIRKVMGANLVQIVRMLIWQFSKPVLWALFIALPASYIAAEAYLGFFPDRIDSAVGIVLGAGIAGIGFSWAVVAAHAVKIARANPIIALRYE